MTEREFKFRYWDEAHREFLYSDSYKPFWRAFPIWLKEHPERVHQYVGLKDKNGRHIYEEDITRVHRLRNPERHQKQFDFSKLPWPENHWYDCVEVAHIRYSDVSLGFVEDYDRFRYDDIWPLSCGTGHRYEVIGNTFQNPELLNSHE